MIDLSPQASTFFKVYQVRMPSPKKKNHDLNFIDKMVQRIDDLEKMGPHGEEIDDALAKTRSAWENAKKNTRSRKKEVTPNRAQPRFDFQGHCMNFGVRPPRPENTRRITSVEEVEEHLDNIERAIQGLPKEKPGFAMKKLKGWRYGWIQEKRKWQMDFDSEGTRKGPPSHVLAKKAQKRADSQKIRNSMKKK